MAAIVINDLPASRTLDRKALASIKGGGAPWVFGWIRPFAPASSGLGPVVNFYQINNSFHAEQMINQFQVVDIRNSAANANINVILDEQASNFGPARSGTGGGLAG